MAKFLDTESVEHDLEPGVIAHHAETLGEHTAKLEGLDTWQNETKETLEGLDAKVSSALDLAANRPAEVPDAVWSRIGDLEQKVAQIGTAAEEAAEEAEEEITGEPIPIQAPAPAQDSEPKAKGSNLLRRVARAFR